MTLNKSGMGLESENHRPPCMPPKQAIPPSRSAYPRVTRHVSHGTIAIWIMCVTCAKPIQWDGSSLTLSTRPPPQPQPSAGLSSPPPHLQPPTIKNKTIATLPAASQPSSKHAQPVSHTKPSHGRRELQRRRAQARRGSAPGRRRRLVAGEEGAAGRARGPPRRAARPGGRLRRHRHHRIGQGRDHR